MHIAHSGCSVKRKGNFGFLRAFSKNDPKGQSVLNVHVGQ